MPLKAITAGFALGVPVSLPASMRTAGNDGAASIIAVYSDASARVQAANLWPRQAALERGSFTFMTHSPQPAVPRLFEDQRDKVSQRRTEHFDFVSTRECLETDVDAVP